MRIVSAVALGLVAIAVPARADDHAAPPKTPITVTAGRLVDIPLMPAQGDAKSVVVYLSDIGGWSVADTEAVTALTAGGSVVLAVDFHRYAALLDKDDGKCLYVVGEITDLAQTAERQLGISDYFQPIVAGSGEGATFAYAALADSPDNTLGGAAGYGFANRLSLRLPFCPGATSEKTPDGKARSYGFDVDLPGSARLFSDPELTASLAAAAGDRDEVGIEDKDPDDMAGQLTAAVADLAEDAKPFGELPAIDLPPDGKPGSIAVLVSGDGGWRDLDKTIGEWLSDHGVHVIGLDALHYFWTKRTPKELARDIASMVEDGDPTGKLPVTLIGYSFGADTIPFAFPLLPKALRGRTRLIALMAPGSTTSFQVTVDGWLGIDDSGYAIAPAIAGLPLDRVICLYGEDEDDAACPDPSLKKATIIKTEGGHHFDGDYDRIAKTFLDRMKAN